MARTRAPGGPDGAAAHHLQPGLAGGTGRAGGPAGRQPGAAAGRQLGAEAARAALGELGEAAALRRQLGTAPSRHNRRQLGARHRFRQLGAAARRQQPPGPPALPRRLLQPRHPRRAQQGERIQHAPTLLACAHPPRHVPTPPGMRPPSLLPPFIPRRMPPRSPARSSARFSRSFTGIRASSAWTVPGTTTPPRPRGPGSPAGVSGWGGCGMLSGTARGWGAWAQRGGDLPWFSLGSPSPGESCRTDGTYGYDADFSCCSSL